MLSTFADLDDSAVDADPLLLLPCGHVFNTSTLDGWMDMTAAYEGIAAGLLRPLLLIFHAPLAVRVLVSNKDSLAVALRR